MYIYIYIHGAEVAAPTTTTGKQEQRYDENTGDGGAGEKHIRRTRCELMMQTTTLAIWGPGLPEPHRERARTRTAESPFKTHLSLFDTTVCENLGDKSTSTRMARLATSGARVRRLHSAAMLLLGAAASPVVVGPRS